MDIRTSGPPSGTDTWDINCDLTKDKIVFVLSQPQQGTLLMNDPARFKGQTFTPEYLAADRLCQDFAANSNQNQSVYSKKHWMAWLSVPQQMAGTAGAIDRITRRLNVTDPDSAANRWCVRNGETPVLAFQAIRSLKVGPVFAIAYNEDNNLLQSSDPMVWTGTINGATASATGTPPVSPHCLDLLGTPWSGNKTQGLVGNAKGTKADWTNASSSISQIATKDCTQLAHLYCFEVDKAP